MRDLLLIFFAAFVGGFASAALSRRRREKELAAQEERIKSLLLNEFTYWSDADDGEDDTQSAIHIGAVGAVSNVLAAMAGHPAPWHKPNSRKHQPVSSLGKNMN